MNLFFLHQAERRAGFTLIELLVAIGLIAILSAIAGPLFLQWIPNLQLTSASRDIYGVLTKAKGEAAKRNRNCTVVFRQTIAGTAYAYVLFEDANGNSEYDAGEPLITSMINLPSRVFFDTAQGGGDGLSFTDNDDGNPSISFQPNSVPTDNGGVLLPGTVGAFLKNSSGRTKSIVVNQFGNIRIP